MTESSERKLNENAVRSHNAELARTLAAAGIAVFPSQGKVPLVPLYTRLENEITTAEREEAVQAYIKRNGFEPRFVGATINPDRARRMFRHFKDATPSISMGPSGLIAIDADAKHGGPEKLASLMRETGGLPEGAVVVTTQSGGQHLYFRNRSGLTNRAGAMKRDYGCDIRGQGGQCVAPSAIRLEDGKTYGTKNDLRLLLQAFRNGSLPELPEAIVEKIGQNFEAEPTSETEVNALTRWLAAQELTTDNAIEIDLEELQRRDSALADLMLTPSGDHSTDRFNFVIAILRNHPKATARDCFNLMLDNPDVCGEFVEGKPEAGQFNLRNAARDFLRAAAAASASYNGKPTDGSAFGVVDEGVVDRPHVSGHQRGFDLFQNYKPQEWLVENVFPAVGVGALYADGNVGKSFLALDACDAVKRRDHFFTKRVVNGEALYNGGEGQGGLASRVKALYDESPPKHRDATFAIRGDLPSFEPNPITAARRIAKAAKACSEETGQPVRLIVLDNLALMLGSKTPENDAAPMAAIFKALNVEVAQKLHCCVLVIHHSTKDGSAMRGSTAIRNSADFVWAITEDATGVRTLKANKLRDAAKTGSFRFKLKIVEIGRNQFGNPITSCVVVPMTASDRTGEGIIADENDDAPTIAFRDRREDRLQSVLDVFEARARSQAADDENAAKMRRLLELQTSEIVEAINRRRKGDGLEALARSTVQDYTRQLAENGKLESVGTAGRPRYRLAGR